jgi:hypothetical protein
MTRIPSPWQQSGAGPFADKEGSMFSKLITTAALFMVVAVGTASAGTTPQGLKADGLRLQAMADRYQQLRGTTPDGIRADGLRLQAIARAYQSRPAATYYTPQALQAMGHRWTALAQAYRQVPPSTVSSSSGFDWADAGIGAAGGLVLFVSGAIAVLFARRLRRAKLAL